MADATVGRESEGGGGGGEAGEWPARGVLEVALLGAGGWFIAEVATGALVGVSCGLVVGAPRGGVGHVLYGMFLCGLLGGLLASASGTVFGLAAGAPIGVTSRALGRNPLAAAGVAVALGGLTGTLEALAYCGFAGPGAFGSPGLLAVGAARGVASGLAAAFLAR